MALDESKNTNDNLQNIDNIKVVIGEDVMNIFGQGAPIVIDFHKFTFGEGFTINNGTSC